MRGRTLAGCLAAALAACPAGCRSGGSAVETNGAAYREVNVPLELVAESPPYVPDLPVPVGFKLDESRSRNFTSGHSRWVDHLYKGNDEKFALARFCKRHMPISRWVLMTDRFTQGSILLDFEKDAERCQIIISDGSLLHRTYMKVQVWSSGPIAPPESGAGKTNRP